MTKNDQTGDPRASLLLTRVRRQSFARFRCTVVGRDCDRKGHQDALKKPYRQNLYKGDSSWQQVERGEHFRLFKAVMCSGLDVIAIEKEINMPKKNLSVKTHSWQQVKRGEQFRLFKEIFYPSKKN